MAFTTLARLAAVALMIPAGAHAERSVKSEIEHELYRELHRAWPAYVFPPPDTVACHRRLGAVAHFQPLPVLTAPAQCAIADLVRLDRVVMPDRSEVAVSPPPTLRCAMAEAVADWVRADVGPLSGGLGAPLVAITDLDSYQCRPRNGVAGAKLSEHAKGNALDVGAVKLGDGRSYALTDPKVPKPFREEMRAAACRRFTTVLGPGSDAYHEEHIHLDLIQRTNGYRICQWDVREPGAIAGPVPLPLPRPAALPSRTGQAGNR